MAGWQRVLWIAGAAALVASCSSGSPDAAEHKTPPSERLAPRVAAADAVIRPKQFFDNLETIERATNQLANDCMESKGLHPGEVAQLVDRVQGELAPDMPYRRSEGYGFSSYLRPIWQVASDEADEWYQVYWGSDPERVRWRTIAGEGSSAGGGCLGDARAEVAGSRLTWFWATQAQQDYWLITAAAVNRDPRWDEAVARWVSCMDEAGFPGLGGPTGAWKQARRDVFGAHGAQGKVPEEVRRAEVALAVADGKCQLATGMVDVQRTIREDFLEDAAPRFLHDLDRIAKAQRVALETIVSKGLDQ